MTPWLLIGIAVVIALAWGLGHVLLPAPGLPYYKRDSLLTPAELRFFHALREAVDGEWSIQTMVRMADLIRVRSKTAQSRTWLNKILAKHVDFLLCEHDTLEAQLAVELDDSSHQRPDRIERDQFINQALSSAQIPLLRVPVQEDYDVEELRDQIEDLVG